MAWPVTASGLVTPSTAPDTGIRLRGFSFSNSNSAANRIDANGALKVAASSPCGVANLALITRPV